MASLSFCCSTSINEQSIHPNTRSFLYADDICIATQKQSFEADEKTLGDAFADLTPYYAANNLRANPEKSQLSTFHLKNRDAQREVNVVGSTLERSLACNDHIAKTKTKTEAMNSIIKKLANTNWGTDARTMHATALAICSPPRSMRPSLEQSIACFKDLPSPERCL